MDIEKFIISAIIILAIFCCVNVQTASAVTMEEMQAKIAQLVKQLQTLRAQLEPQDGWCYSFAYNFGPASSGTSEIAQLHKALRKEGITFAPDKGNTYGAGTIAAVNDFQEKYASEILLPYGLKKGTGYVGASTRAKLNQLNACQSGGTGSANKQKPR